jgi:hypothetical protein
MLRTKLVTWPPLTRISKFPEPAPEPSTVKAENKEQSWNRQHKSRTQPLQTKCFSERKTAKNKASLLSNSTGCPSTPLGIRPTWIALAL